MTNDYFRAAADKLGFRQKAYQQTFGGSNMQLVLVDLAKYACAFEADPDNIPDATLRRLQGRRDMFFRIIKHLKLSPMEIEQVYAPVLMSAANRLARQQGAGADD
jgi:hypothetical protein